MPTDPNNQNKFKLIADRKLPAHRRIEKACGRHGSLKGFYPAADGDKKGRNQLRVD